MFCIHLALHSSGCELRQFPDDWVTAGSRWIVEALFFRHISAALLGAFQNDLLPIVTAERHVRKQQCRPIYIQEA
jgi:hypothetical protein